MKEPHEEGLASHSAPSFAPSTARYPVKRKQGHRRVGYPASKNCNRDADAVVKAEGNTVRRDNASAWPVLRGLRTWHVGTLFAREPGDLGGACSEPHDRPAGEGK